VAGGILLNIFNPGLRCVPVNGWVAAFQRRAGKTPAGAQAKAGDMAWHSSKRIDNQMLVLEQFDLLPIMVFSVRYHELIGGGAQGQRWVHYTQSIQKGNGKLVYDSGSRFLNPTNVNNAYYDAFTLDVKTGTINLTGFNGTLQHYIDDGRAVPTPAGATMGPGTTAPTAGMPLPLPPGVRIIRNVQPLPAQIQIQVLPAPLPAPDVAPLPPAKNVKKGKQAKDKE
jgi:hypothetical protein